MNMAGPLDDDKIPEYLHALGIPGLADIHVHFLPEPMMRKVCGRTLTVQRKIMGGRGRSNTALTSNLG
jgi:hypothetical protein